MVLAKNNALPWHDSSLGVLGGGGEKGGCPVIVDNPVPRGSSQLPFWPGTAVIIAAGGNQKTQGFPEFLKALALCDPGGGMPGLNAPDPPAFEFF